MRDIAPDYTVDEVARVMSVHPSHVRKLIATGQLEAYRSNQASAKRNDLRITPDALDRFRRARLVTPLPVKPRRVAKTLDYPKLV